MRTMLQRVSPVLLVSVMVGGFVVMSTLPATAENRSDRLDHLHAVRPDAASTSSTPQVVDPGFLDYLASLDRLAQQPDVPAPADPPPPDWAPAPSWAPGPAIASAPPSGSCAGDVDCFLACTKAHESDTAGGYGAVSSGGAYRGAYQFSQSTWDVAVSGAGHDEYAGVPADEVPADVQDAAAAHLYSEQGTSAWGGRC